METMPQDQHPKAKVKAKWSAGEARAVAADFIRDLRPVTLPTPKYMRSEWSHPNLIAIAGSLRREKELVGDIEILFVPMMTSAKNLFGESLAEFSNSDLLIAGWLGSGRIAKRLSKDGKQTWGPENKLAVHVASGIPVDFFATTVEKWFVSLVIRTGSKETNLRLTTGANKQGATLNAYGEGVTWSDETITRATSERHVFEMCGVPYLEPTER